MSLMGRGGHCRIRGTEPWVAYTPLMRRVAGVLPGVWVLVLVLLLLGPALLPGFVLSYDMVWVPDLALRADLLGVGSALPRNIPSDAVVAVVDELVPGMLLQKLVLVGALVSAGLGCQALVGGTLLARLVAGSLAVWSPFVAERLVIGHWPVLLAYGLLPWLLLAGRAEGRHRWLRLGLLLPLGSLSASAGLMSAAAALAGVAGERPGRRTLATVAGLCLAVNLPWVIGGLLAGGSARTAGADGVFVLSGEGWLPAPLAALGLGGIWNAEVVPVSRTDGRAVVLLVALLALALLGARSWWRSETPGRRAAVLALWLLGQIIAVSGWVAPQAVSLLGSSLPGVGILRDGSRYLALALPLTVVLGAAGAEAIGARLSPVARIGVGMVLVLFPVTLAPDLARGVSGSVQAVAYPPEYAEVRARLDRAGTTGDVLILPFTSYRAPAWNGYRKVLDPIPRVLSVPSVSSDDLIVDDRTIQGEDPHAQAVRAALDLSDPAERSAALADLGIALVLTDRAALGDQDSPELAARPLLSSGSLLVTRLEPGPRRSIGAGPARVGLLTLAWLGFLAPLGWAIGIAVRRYFGHRRFG